VWLIAWRRGIAGLWLIAWRWRGIALRIAGLWLIAWRRRRGLRGICVSRVISRRIGERLELLMGHSRCWKDTDVDHECGAREEEHRMALEVYSIDRIDLSETISGATRARVGAPREIALVKHLDDHWMKTEDTYTTSDPEAAALSSACLQSGIALNLTKTMNNGRPGRH
jgi:hypothetical protein